MRILLLLLVVVLELSKVYCGQFLYLEPNGTKPNNTEARALCASYGKCQLAIIDSQAEYDRMYAYLNQTLGYGFVLPTAFWIGMYMIDTTGLGNYVHFWDDDGNLVPLSWTYWDAGEPNGFGYELCARIHTNMYLRTINCEYRYNVLCEGIGSSACINSENKKEEEECKLFAPCWWTPAKIGLSAGFTSLFVFFCLCCVGWKCICEPKNQVGYEMDEEESDDDADHQEQNRRPHNIAKNHNIDHMPVPTVTPRGINSVILSHLSSEEQSFSQRYSYKQ